MAPNTTAITIQDAQEFANETLLCDAMGRKDRAPMKDAEGKLIYSAPVRLASGRKPQFELTTLEDPDLEDLCKISGKVFDGRAAGEFNIQAEVVTDELWAALRRLESNIQETAKNADYWSALLNKKQKKPLQFSSSLKEDPRFGRVFRFCLTPPQFENQVRIHTARIATHEDTSVIDYDTLEPMVYEASAVRELLKPGVRVLPVIRLVKIWVRDGKFGAKYYVDRMLTAPETADPIEAGGGAEAEAEEPPKKRQALYRGGRASAADLFE